ncbi:MAG: Holliday junction resolvase RuvX [Aquificaceae bacterium]
MKVLSIDYGTKKIGLALGDTALKIASPFKVLKSRESVVEEIISLVEEYSISIIVVGLPLTLRGMVGERARDVESFVKKLKERLKESVEVVLWDERFTTEEAYRLLEGLSYKKKKELKDSLSSYIILKEYLESL